MRRTLPLDAHEAYIIVEVGARPTLAELDAMPQSLVEGVMLYGMVKSAIEYGQEVSL
jgi:hypothetical protein